MRGNLISRSFVRTKSKTYGTKSSKLQLAQESGRKPSRAPLVPDYRVPDVHRNGWRTSVRIGCASGAGFQWCASARRPRRVGRRTMPDPRQRLQHSSRTPFVWRPDPHANEDQCAFVAQTNGGPIPSVEGTAKSFALRLPLTSTLDASCNSRPVSHVCYSYCWA